MKKTDDLKILKKWIASNCETPMRARAYIEYKTGIGHDSLARILRGARKPRSSELLAIGAVTGLKFSVHEQEA